MRSTTRHTPVFAAVTLAAVAALGLSACGTSDEPTPAASGSAGGATAAADCSPESMKTLTAGTLTVGTDSPAYEPWFSDNDPTNGKGYESAVTYAVAKQLGYADADVKWQTVSFTQAIAPGVKTFDIDVNQISITDERKAMVDFSSGYYDVTQAVITVKGSKIADAKTLADLKGATLGAVVGSTSLDAITKDINPSAQPMVYNDNDMAKQALEAGTVDGIVVDLPTAFYMTGAELDGGIILGQLPSSTTGGEQLGFVLDLGSPLTQCVSKAVDALRADGTLASLQEQWLAGGGAPVLK